MTVLPSFTGFYWDLLGFIDFYCVLLVSIGVYWVLLGFACLFNRFYWVYWVLLTFTVFY